MNKKIYLFFFKIISFFIFIFSISYKVSLNNLPDNIIDILNYKYTNKSINLKIDFISIILNNYKTKYNYFDNKLVLNNVSSNDEIKSTFNNLNDDIIYIYNTHTNEEYSYEKNDLYNITPTVLTASYILKNELENLGYKVIVEENNVTDILTSRNLTYDKSYEISRELLEKQKGNNSNIKYYIDIHRDSVKRNITTQVIDDKTYARCMFLLGLENKNYELNKEVMTTLNNYLEDNYKGLSRGIYEKKGIGVNGIYNQDYDKNVILIEVGGVDNTIGEVANTLKVIALMIDNYLSLKTTNLE